jgi:tight adherence protein C
MNILDSEMLLNVCVMLAVMATFIAFASPYLAGDDLQARLKTVAFEKTKMRDEARANLSKGINARTQKALTKEIIEKFNLVKYLGQDEIKIMLRQAGHRSPAAYTKFLMIRMFLPLIAGTLITFYLFFIFKSEYSVMVRAGMAAIACFFMFKLPTILLRNQITKRYDEIKLAFPDALDLLLICIESGMSVEVAMKKVSLEIGMQSIALAEEFALTVAELSFLPDRKQAYENLAERLDLDGVKAVVLALTQAEKYGTPLGQAMRVMAQENRDIRMHEAEKKAAGIPPKLTVPMIVCFLPVLFIVILGPAAIKVMGLK